MQKNLDTIDMQTIAIIGSGISGLGAAYLLKDNYAITVYEKNAYFGGHARTLLVKDDLPIDTGFIVFNHRTYPHLVSLFKQLDIPLEKSDMSFGVSVNNHEFEYGSKKVYGLFAQFVNIFRPRFWRLIVDILRFNSLSKKRLANNTISSRLSLRDYLKEIRVSQWFCEYYLVAMGAAIWSTPLQKMYDFPALTFLQFFQNHGLLDIFQPIQWYTIAGGSRVYVEKILQVLRSSNVTFKGAAKKIIRQNHVTVVDERGDAAVFDKIIFATHSDQALALLEQPTSEEQEILGAIPYQKNHVILHQDCNLMPARKAAWSSWVYLSDNNNHISLSYWMNSLQPLATEENYFVTLNPSIKPLKNLIIDEYVFEHPVFNQQAIAAQSGLPRLQGSLNTYYCGAYHRYGFHEDGLWSAVNVAKLLGVSIPW